MEHRITETVNEWAAKVGWKKVAIAITEKRHELVGDDKSCLTADNLRAVIQNVKRTFTIDTPSYRKKRRELTEATLAALPTAKRMKAINPQLCDLKFSSALESFGNAMAAFSIKCPSAAEKIANAISHLDALLPIAQLFT